MDIDAQEPVVIELIDYFDLSPEGFAWRGSRPADIEARRAEMSDQLIFDVLLTRGGIREPDRLWPPYNTEGLRRLLDAIQTSTYDNLKNDCLIYFLLKWYQDGREIQYAQELVIPPQFVAITDAYWHLDSGIDPERAISLLSDARVHREYSSKVIQALSAAPNPASLIVRFVRTVKPALTEPSDIEAYAIALAETSLIEAWFYQRSYPDEDNTRTQLLRKIIQWCVNPVRPSQLKQLLSLPMSPYEQAVLHDLALEPPQLLPPSAIALLQDLVCTRLIQAGALARAVVMDRRFRSVPSAAPADARRQMIDEVLAILPSVDHLALDDELAAIGAKHPSRPLHSKPIQDPSLGISWEDILPSLSTPPTASASKKKVPRKSFNSQPVHIGGRKSQPFAQNGYRSPASASHSKSAAAISGQPSPFAGKSSPFGPKAATNLSGSNPNSDIFGSKHKASPFSTPDDNPFAPPIFDLHRQPVRSAFPLSPNASASQQQNAFFNPPAFKPREPSPPVAQPEDVNVNAYTAEPEDEHEPEPEPPESEAMADPEAEEVPSTAEIAREIFSATASKAPLNQRAIHEVVREPPSPSTSPPPAKAQATRAARKSRARVPGAFEHEDEYEDEDDVPPLPPSPVKHGRRTRASAGLEAPRVTRRSSRLSVASSSPDPISASPKKTTRARKTRASASAVSASAGVGPSAGKTRSSRKR